MTSLVRTRFFYLVSDRIKTNLNSTQYNDFALHQSGVDIRNYRICGGRGDVGVVRVMS